MARTGGPFLTDPPTQPQTENPDLQATGRASDSNTAVGATGNQAVRRNGSAATSWRSEGRLCVVLARQPDDGSDTINAEATGAARISVPLRQIVGLIGNFDCESLRLEAGAEGPW